MIRLTELKLPEVTQKTLDGVLEVIIRSQISIDDMQFGFMPDHVTTDAVFILRKLHGFVDLEMALIESQCQFYGGQYVNWTLTIGMYAESTEEFRKSCYCGK